MTKKMLINATHPEENRVAIVEDGILSELDIEIAGKEQTRGNIYKASVVRIEPGLQAAFIDYGAERFGFLQMGEIHPNYFRGQEGNGENRRARINDVLRRGQELLVQVVKEERGTKGAALTTYLSLPGRYMVLMPESNTKGISRKIEEESQRKKLKEAMNSLDLPQDMGYIVRTAGIGQTNEELKRDFDYLVRVYRSIQEQASKVKAPALIYKESNLVIRSIRDYFTSDVDEVLVDDAGVADEARSFFQQVMPEYARLVKLHQERRPIFARYQIEEQIETITKNKVALPSGGSIVIDVTEALVAVDVNSGKMAGEQGVESTAFKTNLEAATEVARQLRLRDLGGLIVIDFIDMRERKHIREIEKCLKDNLKSDKARVTLGRISQFGLLEMSRQRIRAALAEGSYLPCPHCNGSGRIKSAEAQAIAFLRKVHAAVAKGQIGRVEGEVPLEVATYLLNVKREELLEMERRHQIQLVIKGRPDFLAGQSDLVVLKREKEENLPETPLVSVPPPSEPQREEELPSVHQEAEESEAETSSEDSGKKKRRRRRRKKKPEETPAAAAGDAEKEPETALSEEEPTLPAEATAHTPAPEISPEPEAAPNEIVESMESAEAEEEQPKKRRRRRRRKPASTEEIPAEAASSGEPLPEPPPAIPQAPPAPAAEAQPQAAPSTPETPQEPPAPVEDKPSAEPQPAEPPSTSVTEEKPRRKRPARRKTSPQTQKPTEPVEPGTKPEQEEPRGVSAAAPGSEEQFAAPAADLEKPPAPRKRPARRKKPEPAEKAQTEEQQDTPAETATEPPEPATKKRAPRKTAARTKGEAKAKQEETPEGEEKPKRTRRTTARTKKTEVEAGAETGGAQPPSEQKTGETPPEEAEQPQKTPRRRSPAKKKAEQKTEESSD